MPSLWKPKFSKGWLNTTAKVVIDLIILILLILAGVTIYHHFKKPTGPPAAASPSQVEAVSQNYANTVLNKKDYTAYQLSEVNTATLYFNNQDVNGADNVMQQVLKNVPASQLSVSSYELLVGIEDAKGDKQLSAHYIQLLIPKLQAQDRTQEATHYQNELKTLQ